MKPLVTGGRGGIGSAIVARLEREGYDVEPLDLVDGFDVTDAAAWERVERVDLAFLNAGVLTGDADPRTLRVEDIVARTEYALAGRFATIATVDEITGARSLEPVG